MTDRLLRASEHINKQLFEQFNGSYSEQAHNIVKSITRGGNPEYYTKKEILEGMYPILKKQRIRYTIRVEQLPYTIPYINFDVPNQEIDELKNALGGRGLFKDYSKNSKPDQDVQSANHYLARLESMNTKYQSIFGITKTQWYEQYPDISYTLNKEGMRNTFDLEELEDNKFIPVFGDSNTFGMGLPVEELWYNKLNLKLPVYNSAVISGSLTDVFLLLRSMYNTRKFKEAYVVIPHSERWTGVSDKGYIEGISNGPHYFLNQFKDASESLNINTRQLYRWMATQALINFCIVNDIKLHIWDHNTFSTVKWCLDQDLYVPNWMSVFRRMMPKLKITNNCGEDIEEWPKHTARDFVHFGTEWHDKIAEYMLTNKAI
jgi:hypothetical protein